MAQIQVEEIIDHLSSEISKALAQAVNYVDPDADCTRNELFRAFKREVRRKCSQWEKVPDRCVRQ